MRLRKTAIIASSSASASTLNRRNTFWMLSVRIENTPRNFGDTKVATGFFSHITSTRNQTMSKRPCHLCGSTNWPSSTTTCPICIGEDEAAHDRLTAENAPPLNPQGNPDWNHPDFDRCSNDWWRLGLCDHCRADGCKAHFTKQYPTLFPENAPAQEDES